MDAQTQGGQASEHYLKGLNTYATLNELRAQDPLSDNDVKQVQQFRRLFEGLLATPDAHPSIFGRQPLPATHADMTPGQYLLKIDQQILALSVKDNGHFTLYHPNVGAMHITGADVSQNRQVLETTLRHHMAPSTAVTLYKVDLTAARAQFSGLRQLQTLLGEYKPEAQRLAAAPDITLSAVPIAVAVLHKMGARIDGKPFSVDHLQRLSPQQVAEQLRFDAQKLARYLHQADYSTVEAQQAVRFLRQQIPAEGSMENRLIDSGNPAAKASVLAQLDAIRQQVTFRPQPTAGSQAPKLVLDIAPTLGDALKSVPIAGRARLQRFTSRAGGTMQGYGYLRSLSDLTKYNRRLQNQSLPPAQREQLTRERDMALFALSSNMAIDLTQEGLGIWGSRLTQLGLQSGFKLQLARFGGPALGVLSSGFDFYQAFRAFSQLATTTDPTLRQDLIVEGSLSLTGALVSIGVPLAFALGGGAAAVAGPVGLAFGAALLLAGGIYSAVREVDEIKKIVKLDGWETFQAGVLAFTGQDQTPEVENQVTAYQLKEEAEEALTARLEQAAKTVLRANINIETLYLSRGVVKLNPLPYRRIVETDIAKGEHIIRDRIPPTAIPSSDAMQQEAASYAIRYSRGNRGLTFQQSEGKAVVRLEEYSLNYYLPYAEGVDEVVDLNDEDARLPATVLKKPFIGADQPVGSFVATADHPLPTVSLNPLQNDTRAISIDIDHDGHRELAFYSIDGFYFLKSDGKGGYGAQQRIDSIGPLIWPTIRTTVGDINGDGWDDMVAVGDSSDPVLIFLAHKNGSFARREQSNGLQRSFLSDAPPVLLDVDRDGRADFVSFTRDVSHDSSGLGHVNISYGKPVKADDALAAAAGIFEPAQSMALSTLYPASVPASVAAYLHRVVGDIDGDGDDDIVSITQTGDLYTLLSSGNRQMPFIAKAVQHHDGIKRLFTPEKFNNAQIQLHDMNGDQRADLVVIQDDGSYTIAEGQADGTFGPAKAASRQNRFAPRGASQIVNIIDENGEKFLVSLRPTGEAVRAPFRRPSEADSINKVNMGEGNDRVLGKRDRKNDFDIGGGTKQFTGGSQADSFRLLGQAAPTTPHVLDGGQGAGSDRDQGDTVIASRQPMNGKSTLLALDIGLAAYYREGQRQDVIDRLARIAQLTGQAREEAITQLNALAHVKTLARLSHIEHAYGQSDVSVLLTGDAGNNTLGLGRGYAAGGKGTDSYHILRNQSATRAQITLKEQAEPQAQSNVLLDYDAEDIASIRLAGEEVWLQLRGDNGAHTELRLENMYRLHADGQQKSLQHAYVLHTRDGLRITGWPQTLRRAADGHWPSLTPLTAHYIPEHDQSRQAFLRAARPEDIQVEFITPSREGEKQVKVTIKGKPVSRHENNSPTRVPHFLQLAQVGTKFSTHLQGDKRNNTLSTTPLPGDEENNRLWHQHGKDRLKGKGGADRYHIQAGARNVEIDNQDNGSENGGYIAQDIMLLPWSFEDMRIEKQDNNDVVLSHASAPSSYPIVRIKHFMKHAEYRHLWLQDKNGVFDKLDVTPKNEVLFNGLQEVQKERPAHRDGAQVSSALREAMSGLPSSGRATQAQTPASLTPVNPHVGSLSTPFIAGA